jgi:inner membrane transporter RhtA
MNSVERHSARTGSVMTIMSMSCVQLGLAASVALSTRAGAEAVAWLRLSWAAVVLLAVVRPWRTSFSGSALRTCIVLGIVTAGMTLLYMAAIVRLPLGTASALEFLGPLAVAVCRGRAAARWWAVAAAAGVLMLTEPWRGGADPAGVALALSSAGCWAAYILLTQRAGDEVTGLHALAVSMSVAAVAATLAVGPLVIGRLNWPVLGMGLGVALLTPVIPFSLEMLALRRLTASAFGILMSLEPAMALVIGFAVLDQVPRPGGMAGIVLVVAAGIGAARTGARTQQPSPYGSDTVSVEPAARVTGLRGVPPSASTAAPSACIAVISAAGCTDTAAIRTLPPSTRNDTVPWAAVTSPQPLPASNGYLPTPRPRRRCPAHASCQAPVQASSTEKPAIARE